MNCEKMIDWTIGQINLAIVKSHRCVRNATYGNLPEHKVTEYFLFLKSTAFQLKMKYSQ